MGHFSEGIIGKHLPDLKRDIAVMLSFWAIGNMKIPFTCTSHKIFK